MKNLLKLLFSSVFMLNFFIAFSQDTPFWKEIAAYKKQDSIAFPLRDAIVFVGSSSFNYWKDVQSYFPNHMIINRGFGGSTLPDVIRYADQIIFPYKPRQVVIYCGENDLAKADSVSAEVVFARFKTLYQLIRNKLGNVSIAFVSIKPSPSRQHLMPKIQAVNALIKKFLSYEKYTAYINVYDSMLNDDGTPIADIFIKDNLHMNAKGYTIWAKCITPYLVKQ